MASLLVFDLDGTLVDSSRDIAAAMNAALRRLAPGTPEIPRPAILEFVGEGARLLVERSLRHVGLPPATVFRYQEEGFGLPVVGATCDFYRPVWYGETMVLLVSVLKVSNRAVTFEFRFHRPGKEDLLAKGQATVVAIGSDWLSRALPERVREAVAPFLTVPVADPLGSSN